MKVFIVGAVAVLCFTPAYSSIIRGNGQQYINSEGLGKDKLEAVQQYQPTNGWEVVSQLITCVNEKLESLEEVFNQLKTVFPVELGKTYPYYNNQGPDAGRVNGNGKEKILQQIVAPDAVKGRSHGQSEKQKKEEKLNHEITKLLTAGLIASNMKEKFEEEEKAKEEEETRRMELQRKLLAAQLLAEAVSQGGSGSGHKSSNHKSGIEQSNINVANHNIGHQFSSSQSNSARVQQEKAELEKLQQLQNLLSISNVGQDANVNTAGFNSGQTNQAAHNRPGNVNSNNKQTLENFMNQLQTQSAKINGAGGNVNVGQNHFNPGQISQNGAGIFNSNDKPSFENFMNKLQKQSVEIEGVAGDVNVGQTSRQNLPNNLLQMLLAGGGVGSGSRKDDGTLLGRGDVKHVNNKPNFQMTFLNAVEQSTDNQGGNRDDDDDDLLGRGDVKHVEKEASTSQLIAQIMEDMNGQKGVQGRSRSEKEDINNLIINQEINDIKNRIQDQIIEDSNGFDGQSFADANHNTISVLGEVNSLSNVATHHGRQQIDDDRDDTILNGHDRTDVFLLRQQLGNHENTISDPNLGQASSKGFNFNFEHNFDQQLRPFQGRSFENPPATYPGVTPHMAYSSGYDQYARVQPAYQNVLYGGYPTGVAFGSVYPANPGYQQPAYY